MTQTITKLQIGRPRLKLKVLPSFPVSLGAVGPVTLDTTGGKYLFGLDLVALKLALLPAIVPFDQQITAAGPFTIDNNASTVRVNQAIGSPITINLPLASNKTTPVLIVDWKGDAGTNNITIVPSGTDTIQGRANWVIAADTGSVFLRPIAGVGYAL